ncbi:hypothetical protein ACFX2C_020994 [Malus domestica]
MGSKDRESFRKQVPLPRHLWHPGRGCSCLCYCSNRIQRHKCSDQL